MSEPRAIPDDERPFIPEEDIPAKAKESTDFDAETAESEATDDDSESVADAADRSE